ncbi:MAG: ATP-dependent helicase [Deltaproteobacteria bacterium]|nr:MAG: ATP-dependent helicase [Deltaproteobacteria bacterium]
MPTYRLKTERPRGTGLDLSRDLNPEQRAVVEAPPGRLLVLAGAGTGKTRALTYRVARLVASGTPPERIMLCTFTNRAAAEMLRRVEALAGANMARCPAGTFHHVGHRIVRAHAERLGLSPTFGILDREDATTILGAAVAELGTAELSKRRLPTPRAILELSSLARGTMRDLAEIVAMRMPQLAADVDLVRDILARYERKKRELGVCDFDDLLCLWHRLLADRAFADAGAALRASVDHVLVDEYQDVNTLQGTICDEMARGCGSLTCVGDDAQSIYGFRGADFSMIEGFTRRHPGATVLTLTTNYRSTPQILALANRSLRCNVRQHRKDLVAVRGPGMVPAVLPLRDVHQQAEFVAQRVLELHQDQQIPLREMAVLYRNHSHGLELQVELGRRQIPFFVRSGARFFEQAHVKDVVAYLRARENPSDTLSWTRVLRLWPGVGARTASRLGEKLAAVEAPEDAARLLADEAKRLREPARSSLAGLAELWRRLCAPERRDPGEAIRTVVAEHYADYARTAFTNAEQRTEDLEHLAAYASDVGSASEFLARVALVQGIGAEVPTAAHDPDDKLVLSSIHQAKGLEWRVVFVLWLVDGRFPGRPALRTPEALEEERRLFYVAATRAADELYLCFPTLEEGRDGPHRLLRPSRFLTELDGRPPVFERWDIEEVPAEDAEGS